MEFVSAFSRMFILELLWGAIGALTLLLVSISHADEEFIHPHLCAFFRKERMHLDHGMYIVPVVRDIPTDCQHDCSNYQNGSDYRYIIGLFSCIFASLYEGLSRQSLFPSAFEHKSEETQFELIPCRMHLFACLVLFLYFFVTGIYFFPPLPLRGSISLTKSGIRCQEWKAKKPHVPFLKQGDYEKHDLQKNFCRNPDLSSKGPWCYTTSKHVRWEHCDVPVCSQTSVNWMHALFNDFEEDVNQLNGGKAKIRQKRGIGLFFDAVVSGLKLAFGISNAVKLENLHQTVTYIGNNQVEIKESLRNVQASITSLETKQKQIFLAVKDLEDYTISIDRKLLCQLNQIKAGRLLDSLGHRRISTSILPPENIIDMLTHEVGLKDTVYIDNPHLIYEMGEVQVLDLDPEQGIVTMLLLLPHINSVPDGFLYTPLILPRFELEDDGVLQEKTIRLPSLIDLTPHYLPPNGRAMIGIDSAACQQMHELRVCKLGSHFTDNSVECANAILQNSTNVGKVCNFQVESKSWQESSFVVESSTHVLIFSNERVHGSTTHGIFEVKTDKNVPSCILVNKVSMKSLSVGNKTFSLNVRSDALMRNVENQHFVRNLCPYPKALEQPYVGITPLMWVAISMGCIIAVGIVMFLLYLHFSKSVSSPDNQVPPQDAEEEL